MPRIVQPCLMCDTPVYLKQEDWDSLGEERVAFCGECTPLVDSGKIPWPMVKMVYIMRCQISHLLGEKDITKRHIKQLFDAQQEIEQAALKAK